MGDELRHLVRIAQDVGLGLGEDVEGCLKRDLNEKSGLFGTILRVASSSYAYEYKGA